MAGIETLLTVAEAAQRLHVSSSMIYALAANRRLAHVRVGTCLRFRESDLAEFVQGQVVAAQPGGVA